MVDAFGIRDGRLVEEGERLAKCVQIIIIARFTDAGVLIDRIVTFHPVEGGFHADVVLTDFRVDEAFEAGIGHGAVGAEHLGTIQRRTAAAWRSGRIRWPHGVRRTVDETAFVIRRGGFDPCRLIGLLQILAMGDECKRLVPREFCRRRPLRIVVQRLLVQMFRDMKGFHGPRRVGKVRTAVAAIACSGGVRIVFGIAFRIDIGAEQIGAGLFHDLQVFGTVELGETDKADGRRIDGIAAASHGCVDNAVFLCTTDDIIERLFDFGLCFRQGGGRRVRDTDAGQTGNGGMKHP